MAVGGLTHPQKPPKPEPLANFCDHYRESTATIARYRTLLAV